MKNGRQKTKKYMNDEKLKTENGENKGEGKRAPKTA